MDDLIERLKPVIVKRGEVTLRSGRKADRYLDLKEALGDSCFLNNFAIRLWRIMDKGITCVVGSGEGGIRLATAISVREGIKNTSVRPERKSYGTEGQIEGYKPTSRDRVAFVDDILTTGGGLRADTEVIKPTGAEIVEYCVGIKRTDFEIDPSISPLKYLFTDRDFL